MIQRVAALFLTALAPLCVAACRSAFVESTIQNNSDTPIHLVEVDYPSASFGMQTLDAHATYHYHFKIQGSGPVTIAWSDSAGKTHTASGPLLSQGQQGSLGITIDPSGGVSWSQDLRIKR